MNERLKNIKGITLIALIITIIILLILASISIATLTGKDGILTKAKNAKTKVEEATIREQIELAVMGANIREDKIGLNLKELETEINKIEGLTGIDKSGEDGKLPWIVKVREYIFEIKENGTVEKVNGIILSKTDLKIIAGETETITAKLTEGIKGDIIWTSSNTSVVTVNNGTITAVGTSGTAEIKAEVIGTDYSASCQVTIVQKVTGISVESLEIEKGSSEQLKVTTIPSSNIEELTYKSNNESIATVDSTGKVTGIAVGTATITVRGTISTEVTGSCTVTVKKVPQKITAKQIMENPKEYYGKIVTNYKASESDTNVYRLFYIDNENYFGDGENTIYLKADCSSTTYSFGNYAQYDKANTKVTWMNPLWSAQRGSSTSSWKISEQAAAYLCSPVNKNNYTETTLEWKGYYKANDEKVNYVIGGPSVEMYIKSYNQAYENEEGIYKLGVDYSEFNLFPGYIYTLNGSQSTISHSDYYTGENSLDNTKYNGMYFKEGNNWGLASPSNNGHDAICYVKNNASLDSRDCRHSYNLSPVISLKSDFIIEINE